MFHINRYFKNITIFSILLYFLLVNCQFKEPTKIHGIVFLKNRSEKLVVNVTNKNDTIRIIGAPHFKSINNDDEWFYVERSLKKGELHKLGKHILKENNILVLNFDKYGIINNKIFLDKNDLKKISFSSEKTINEITQKSFVEKFLSSIKNKMYRNR